MVAVEAVDAPHQCACLICLLQVLQQEGEHSVLKIQTSGPVFTRSRISFEIFVTLEWFLRLVCLSASFAVCLP